jgi:anaerobic ribonucleoside-triphosphate reductase activating protein
MNIAHIEEQSLIYGPGIRFVIWVQGCSIHCKGCWNKDMWSFRTKSEYSIDALISKIIETKDIEGVTILGGEPFDQYDECLNLVKQIREIDLSIILYTGYEIGELKEKKETEILKYIDILISGRFIENLKTMQGGLKGSSNQEIHFLTNNYSNIDLSDTNESEISIDNNGQIIIYGYETNDLQQYI